MSNHAQGWSAINRKQSSLLGLHPAILAIGGIIAVIAMMVIGGYFAEAISPTFLP